MKQQYNFLRIDVLFFRKSSTLLFGVFLGVCEILLVAKCLINIIYSSSRIAHIGFALL
jgi:hypothetical protein